ncbi:hypothetical protein HOY80DRAFT_1070138 [Tuber brumale]|nr:hypothetical protein HOY80DRAFT_1070138 [Tuber brumale]
MVASYFIAKNVNLKERVSCPWHHVLVSLCSLDRTTKEVTGLIASHEAVTSTIICPLHRPSLVTLLEDGQDIQNLLELVEELHSLGQSSEGGLDCPIPEALQDCLPDLAPLEADSGVARLADSVVRVGASGGTTDMAVGGCSALSTIHHPQCGSSKRRKNKKRSVNCDIILLVPLLPNSKEDPSPEPAHMHPTTGVGILQVVSPAVEVPPLGHLPLVRGFLL